MRVTKQVAENSRMDRTNSSSVDHESAFGCFVLTIAVVTQTPMRTSQAQPLRIVYRKLLRLFHHQPSRLVHRQSTQLCHRQSTLSLHRQHLKLFHRIANSSTALPVVQAASRWQPCPIKSFSFLFLEKDALHSRRSGGRAVSTVKVL